jgi:hypothetical protein
MSFDLDPDDEHVHAAIDLHQRHLSDEQMAYRCFADEKILQDFLRRLVERFESAGHKRRV